MNSGSSTAGLPAGTVFTFSQSSLQDYLDCPRRFQLRYIMDMPWPAVEAEPASQLERRQAEALLFHRLVHQRILGMPAAALEGMAKSPDLARWWRNFTSGAPDLVGWQLHPEKALVCGVASHRLICKYDLLAIRDGKAVIYDWKTFARRPTNEWLAARMQTKAYRAMLVRAGAELNGGHPFAPSDISMVYWFAEFPNDPATLDYDEKQHSRDSLMLETLVREIDSATAFSLTDDPSRCRFCTYRSLCDRGLYAGTDAEYELAPMSEGSTENELEQIGELQV